MENKIAIARPYGSGRVGQILQGVGLVLEVFQQGDKDICVCDHGNFGKKLEQARQERAPIVTQIVERPKAQVEAAPAYIKKPKIAKIAPEKKNKELIDQKTDTDEKMILRG